MIFLRVMKRTTQLLFLLVVIRKIIKMRTCVFLRNTVLWDNVFMVLQGIYISKANCVKLFSQKKIGN